MCVLGGKGRLHREMAGVGYGASCLSLPRWRCGVCVVQGCRSVGVTNEHVGIWERTGTNSQFSWIFLANTMGLAE